MESFSAYIPIDRRLALARGEDLPQMSRGAALFADISGFTPLTEILLHELGPQRGPEELTRQLNLVYDALIAEVHRYGGAVINFSGDAITCWLDDDAGLRATACALAMQATMAQFKSIETPAGSHVSLAMKAAVATGPVRRFRVGDPKIQLMDALVGATLERMKAAEAHAAVGEVVVSDEVIKQNQTQIQVAAWRFSNPPGQEFAVVGGISQDPLTITRPWPVLPPQALAERQVSPWLLPPVYERLRSGQERFLAELRPAVALFLKFNGLDYDHDEQVGQKLDTYIRWVQNVLARYESYLLQLTVGDKGSYIYAAFGAPTAHDDDSNRAMAAALELRSPPSEMDFITGVQIGISQGRLRTGAYGGIARRTYGVLGDDVNLAARLMQKAEPGQILVSEVAQQAASLSFVWEALSPIKVKGKAQPVSIFALYGRKFRYLASLQAPTYALPMVGRKAELALCSRKLDKAMARHGQVIGILGETGIGKTRLLAEVISLAHNNKLVGYGGECQSYGTNTSYLVWQPIWRSFFGVDPAWDTATQIERLRQQLAEIDPVFVARLPLLGAVVNLPIPDNDLTAAMDSKLRKTSLEGLLIDCLRSRAAKQPLLLVFEDCQWLDPLSHDLLEMAGRAIADLPVLIVLTLRPPELQRLLNVRLSSLPHFTEMRLTELVPAEVENLVHLKLAQFADTATIADELTERITARAAGNPFYIEELLNYLHNRGVDLADQRATQMIELPDSLHSLVLSRIDQLAESQKITLKVASVIGRMFEVATLPGFYPDLGDLDRIKADLKTLGDLELTQLEKPEPELTYLFKHIITQEVAYESLPYATRAVLHGELGRFLERTYETNLNQVVYLLAYHYERSNLLDKKISFLRKAGELAQSDYNNEAALDYFRRVLPFLPATEQISVRLKLGDVLQLVGEWQQAADIYEQALVLAEQTQDHQAQAQCQTAIGDLLRKRGRFAEATEWLERAMNAFESLGDRAGLAQVYHYSGTLAAQQGDFATARGRYESSLAIRRELGDEPRIAALLSNLGVIARAQGDYDRSQTLHEEALVLRWRTGDRWAIAISLNNLGNLALAQGDYPVAHLRLEEAVTLQREVGDRSALAVTLNTLGNIIREQGAYRAARNMYAESLAINRELGDRNAMAFLLEDFGWLAALQQQPERAFRLTGAARRLRESIGAPLPPADQTRLDQALEPARHKLTETGSTQALAEGQNMTLDQAVNYALRDQL